MNSYNVIGVIPDLLSLKECKLVLSLGLIGIIVNAVGQELLLLLTAFHWSSYHLIIGVLVFRLFIVITRS